MVGQTEKHENDHDKNRRRSVFYLRYSRIYRGLVRCLSIISHFFSCLSNYTCQ